MTAPVDAPRPLRDPWVVASAVAILIIVLVHYTTHGSDIVHALLRRLAYLPIAIVAVRRGLAGGLLTGLAVALLYLPHAFFAEALSGLIGLHIHLDPSAPVDKASELFIYIVLGGVVGGATDASRRKSSALGAVTADLEKTTEDLRRAERLSALGELAAGIAHEVRNPLTALRTTAEILAEAYPEGHPRHRMAALHLSELDRLDQVVQKFLDFARPGPLSQVDVEARSLFDTAQGLMETTAKERAVRIETNPGDVSVRADPDLMVQVLLNLGLNAIQHSPQGGTVTLSAASSEAGPVLSVRDEGPGVDPTLGEAVFDPCVTSRAEGSGLGLSIASRVIEAHGGRLSYKNHDGGGATFAVELPHV